MITYRLKQHILHLAYIHNIKLTNLQFNKILFFAFGLTLAELDIDSDTFKFIDDNYRRDDYKFSRWRYGATVELLYDSQNHFGYRPINLNTKKNSYSTNNLLKGTYYPRLNIFDSHIIKLFKADTVRMIQFNLQLPLHKHYADKILKRNYVPVIELNEIYRDFKNIK